MNYLKATDVHFPDYLIQVKLKETKPLHPVETEQKWVDALFNSLSTKGMKHPILVCTEDNLKNHLHTLVRIEVNYCNDKWKVLVGNNRYAYALNSGYDLIDAYEVRTLEDYNRYFNLTTLEAHQF
jgi:hypothetical protein